MSNGFAKAGFNVTGIDIVNAPELLGYKHSFIEADLTKLNGDDFRSFDVIWGSPPCREFTPLAKVFGHRWKQKPDLQNGLTTVNSFLKFVEKANPQIWIMENHPNLSKHINVKPQFVSKLSKGMKRAFWSNYPFMFLMPTSNKPSIWKHRWDSKLKSWERAKIPIGCALAFAQACKQILETTP